MDIESLHFAFHCFSGLAAVLSGIFGGWYLLKKGIKLPGGPGEAVFLAAAVGSLIAGVVGGVVELLFRLVTM